jgi:hypothetical protein
MAHSHANRKRHTLSSGAPARSGSTTKSTSSVSGTLSESPRPQSAPSKPGATGWS